jgi:nucleoside 2-deoxyribosyltransferase
LNYEEAVYISSEKDLELIKLYFFKQIPNLELLVIKDGAFGGSVVTKTEKFAIPIYQTSKIFKIGTGDIFTAVFGYLWINQLSSKQDLQTIISLASFSTAFYSDNYLSQYKINFMNHFDKEPYKKIFLNKRAFKNKVYLAGPFFNTSQRWHIEDTKMQLEKLGFDVFSPIHEVGEGEANYIAQEDLKGLDNADSIFAILNGYDPGTVFEIGYAIAKGKKVVLFSEQTDEVNLTMFKGSGCLIFNDITTSLYNLVWEMSTE